MANHSYKKYMKQGKTITKDYNLIKLFIISFCGMLLIFIFIIKSFSPSVDTSIGNNQETSVITEKEDIDTRLSALQEEDREKSFSELVKNPSDVETKEPVKDNTTIKQEHVATTQEPVVIAQETTVSQPIPPIYKVYIGSYTSAEQAKVARDIIQDTGSGLTPIVKCIGSNNYTLQVGSYKNKSSAETLLYSVQQNHLPGRIVQE